MTRNAWLFALAMFLAGTIGVFVVETGINTFNVVFFRCLVAAPLLGFYALFTKQFDLSVFTTKEMVFITLGGVALVLNWYFLFKSFELTSITLGIITYNTAPFFLILLGALFLGERVTRRSLIWTSLGFVGLIVITLGDEEVSFGDRGLLLGVGSGLLAALLYAALTFLGKKVTRTSPVFVSFVQTVLGAALLLPFTQLGATFDGGTDWGFVLALGAVHTALLYILFYQGMRGVSIMLLAVLKFIEPVVAMVTDVVFYDAIPTALQLVGVVVILLAAYGVSRPQAEKTEIAAA